MEKFLGKWELVPSLTENFDQYCDKMDIPAPQRETFRSMVFVVTLGKDGDFLTSSMEMKGQPIKQELKYKLGIPFDYKGFEGSAMTSCLNMSGDKVMEKHKAVKDGVTREWDVERYLEGDMMIAISRKDGVEMKSKMKRI